MSAHVNELLIRNESESQGGSLTDRVEELLKGVQLLSVYHSTALICLCVCAMYLYIHTCVCVSSFIFCVLCLHFSPELAKHAEGLFEGVLKCKSRADATRNALTVLQRYRFLFNLPHSIERNIKNVRTCTTIDDNTRYNSHAQLESIC